MFFVKLFIFLVLIFEAANAQNYCNRDLCRGRRHVACGHSGRFSSNCRNPRLINIESHRGLILHMHNDYRNRLAGGGMSRFPSAVQMATMTWNNELARLAIYNVLQCRMQHDQCRNTNAFRFAGQNLAYISTRNIDIESFLRQMIDLWYNEHRDTFPSDMERFRQRGGPAYGHFTVMMHERNTHVGCAVSQYDGGTLLACNYAVTNMINNPIYRFGQTASQCRTGRNPRYRNLCSVNERYNHNEWIG